MNQGQDLSKCSSQKQNETKPKTRLGRSFNIAPKPINTGAPTVPLRQGPTADIGLVKCKCNRNFLQLSKGGQIHLYIATVKCSFLLSVTLVSNSLHK